MKSPLPYLLILLCLGIGGCPKPVIVEVAPPPAPPQTYQGPEFLRATIGSLARLRGYRPMLVSSYALVFNLDSTGSSECPPELKRILIEQIRKGGFESAALGTKRMSAEAIIADKRTAVVRVEGLVPTGAPKGTRFDLLVSALEYTSTTSLEGGDLFSIPLAEGGTQFLPSATTPLAIGRGPIFVNPFLKAQKSAPGPGQDPRRNGRVIAGGVSTVEIPLELVLNQSSHRVAAQIAERINQRFPHEDVTWAAGNEVFNTAVATSGSTLRLHVPKRYRNKTQELLDLISHLYLNPTPDFASEKARELAVILLDPTNHAYAPAIACAWEGMGEPVLVVVRALYDHAEPTVRMTACRAGAALGDVQVAGPLSTMAASTTHPEAAHQATLLLGKLLLALPRNQDVRKSLRDLLDSDDAMVRLAAFEPLAAVDDPTIRRFVFGKEGRQMELVEVRSSKPLVHVSTDGIPRIVIFGEKLGFQGPLHLDLWNHRFMMAYETGQPTAKILYRGPGRAKPLQDEIPASVTYLVGKMAFSPTATSKSTGLDMNYGQIVSVLHTLCEAGYIDAPFRLQASELESLIGRTRSETPLVQRPEIELEGDLGDTLPTPSQSPEPTPGASRPE